MTHEHWMLQAQELAAIAGTREEVPVGALLVHEDQILGAGGNRREQLKRTLAHAEILALEDFNQRFGEWRLPKGSALYVTVEPCMMCTGALLWARVDSIYYGCSDPKNAGLTRLLPQIEDGIFDHQFKVVQGDLLGESSKEMISSFFRKKRKSAKLMPMA